MSSDLAVYSGAAIASVLGVPAGPATMLAGYIAGGLVDVTISVCCTANNRSEGQKTLRLDRFMEIGAVSASGALHAAVEYLALPPLVKTSFKVTSALTSIVLSSLRGETTAKEDIEAGLPKKLKEIPISNKYFFCGILSGGAISFASAKIAALAGAGVLSVPVGVVAGIIVAHETCRRGILKKYLPINGLSASAVKTQHAAANLNK